MLVHGSFPGVIWNWSPMQWAETLKREAEHSRLAAANFKKQGNLLIRPILGSCKMNRFPYLPTVILKIKITSVQSHTQEALTRFNHIPRPRQSQHHTSISKLSPWSSFCHWGRQAEHTFQGQGKECGASNGPVQLAGQLAVTFFDDLF